MLFTVFTYVVQACTYVRDNTLKLFCNYCKQMFSNYVHRVGIAVGYCTFSEHFFNFWYLPVATDASKMTEPNCNAAILVSSDHFYKASQQTLS